MEMMKSISHIVIRSSGWSCIAERRNRRLSLLRFLVSYDLMAGYLTCSRLCTMIFCTSFDVCGKLHMEVASLMTLALLSSCQKNLEANIMYPLLKLREDVMSPWNLRHFLVLTSVWDMMTSKDRQITNSLWIVVSDARLKLVQAFRMDREASGLSAKDVRWSRTHRSRGCLHVRTLSCHHL